MAGRTFGLLLRTADYKGGGILKSCLSEFTLSAVRLSLYRMRPIKEETFIGRTLLDLTHCKSEGIKGYCYLPMDWIRLRTPLDISKNI